MCKQKESIAKIYGLAAGGKEKSRSKKRNKDEGSLLNFKGESGESSQHDENSVPRDPNRLNSAQAIQANEYEMGKSSD